MAIALDSVRARARCKSRATAKAQFTGVRQKCLTPFCYRASGSGDRERPVSAGHDPMGLVAVKVGLPRLRRAQTGAQTAAPASIPTSNLKPQQVYTLTLRKVHAFMMARGFAAEKLLKNTGITPRDLDDPYQLVHAAQARQYYLNVVALEPAGGLGLEIGWTTNLSDMGSHGLFQLTARTAEQAMRSGYSHRYLYNLLLDWNIAPHGDDLVNEFTCDELPGPLRTFLIERGMGTLQAAAEELLGSRARPAKVLVDYQAPSYFRQYEEIFRCPVHFGQDRCEVHYPARYLEEILATHDPQVHGLIGSLQASLVKKLEAKRDVVQDVIMILRRRPPNAFPSLERVAENLAMSARTLRRKLGQEDVTFQQLLDEERRRIAEDYLANSDVSIQQIAESCGFQDAQNFSQAFKRWTGSSPSEYRKSRR